MRSVSRHSHRDYFYGASRDRKSTRLNSSHGYISYAVFCLKNKKKTSPSSPAAALRKLVPRSPAHQRLSPLRILTKTVPSGAPNVHTVCHQLSAALLSSSRP